MTAYTAHPAFAAVFNGTECGGSSISRENRKTLSSLDYTRKAEVAEWQTQRTQNPPSLRA